MSLHFTCPPALRRLGALCLLLPACATTQAFGLDTLRQYTTTGIWAGAPLGASVRLGIALPMNDDAGREWTAGAEAGLQGTKYFVGARTTSGRGGHGIFWGGLDLALWRLRSNPLLAEAHTDYVGLEAQLAVVRLGVMVPTSSSNVSPRVTLGVGFGY